MGESEAAPSCGAITEQSIGVLRDRMTALRAEIETNGRWFMLTTQLLLTGLGVVLALYPDRIPGLLMFLPTVCVGYGAIGMNSFSRACRAGHRIARIEARVNDILGQSVLDDEIRLYIRRRERLGRWFRPFSVVVALIMVAVLQAALTATLGRLAPQGQLVWVNGTAAIFPSAFFWAIGASAALRLGAVLRLGDVGSVEPSPR